MELKNQVCSLEIAQRLKELGVKQESYFSHVSYQNLGVMEENIYDNQQIRDAKKDGWICNLIASAFTSEEIIRMLPRMICDKDQPLSKTKGKCYTLVEEFLEDDYSSGMDVHGFLLRYGNTEVKVSSKAELNSAGVYYGEFESEATVRGKMLIYLLENKLITL